jgi:DoxX-like family
MRTMKVIYWTSTTVFALTFAFTGSLYLVHSPQMATKLALLGYPPYLLAILGTAKILGSIALVFPKYPRLKEWAYAGFVFDFFGAIWSHLAVQGIGRAAAVVLVPLMILAASYVSYRRLQESNVLDPAFKTFRVAGA